MMLKNRAYLYALILILLSTNTFAGMNGFIMSSRPTLSSKKSVNKNAVHATSPVVDQGYSNLYASLDGNSIEKVNPELKKQMLLDFHFALKGGVAPNMGDTVLWANGTLKRIGTDKLLYNGTNSDGPFSIIIDPHTNLNELARKSNDINQTWVDQYGVNLSGAGTVLNFEGVKQQVESDNYSPRWNKENPYLLGSGAGIYIENGKKIYFTKDGKLTHDEFIKTNVYKSLTGANTPIGSISNPSPNKAVTSNSNIDFIKNTKESSIDMLILAAKQYKLGKITKDQYIAVADQVSQTADYYNQIKLSETTKPITVNSPPTNSAVTPKKENIVRYNGKTMSVAEYEKSVCPSAVLIFCQPPENRLQFLKDQIAKAKKPMPLNWLNTFLPPDAGCPGCENFGLDKILNGDWIYYYDGPYILSCDEAVIKYGMFGGDKNNLGNWTEDSNRVFGDSNGHIIGSGAVKESSTYYVDSKTGEQMTEKSTQTEEVGYCRHKQ